jgi:alpha-galactosidase
LHYETIDAKTYASWNVDYLKYDNCYDDGTKPEVRYPPMRDALNATGRPIFFSMCGMFINLPIFLMYCTLDTISYLEWGVDSPGLCAADVGNSWRTTKDIQDSWNSMLSNIDFV